MGWFTEHWSLALGNLIATVSCIIALWRLVVSRFDKKADKTEVQDLKKDIDHITERIDKIYDHLVNGKLVTKSSDER